MLVCVSTSKTLLNSVFKKAGQSIISEYKRQSTSRGPILLDGGHTEARKILFISWELEVERSNLIRAQQVYQLILFINKKKRTKFYLLF